MTERLADVQARIASIEELHEIVGAMRGLAAMRSQEAIRGLASTRAYADIVGAALARAASLMPEAPSLAPSADHRLPRGIVLFFAEHSFAGAFNDRVIAEIEPRGRDLLFAVGSRGALVCEERHITLAWSTPMASHVNALAATARRISSELYRRFSSGEIGGVDIVFARHQGGARSSVVRRALLPVEGLRAAPETAIAPLINLPPAALVEQMLEEYLLGELAHAAMESFASENAARLATMQSARRNIEEKLVELRMSEHRLRQEQITGELLDVATGAAALAPEGIDGAATAPHP